MKQTPYKINNIEELSTLFPKSDRAALSEDAYKQSILGTLEHLNSMPVYELLFDPYLELAERCGMSSVSLKQSSQTERLYLWNVNHGGHYPRLEMRPVRLEHVLDLELMYQLHKDWAYELGVNINLHPSYDI